LYQGRNKDAVTVTSWSALESHQWACDAEHWSNDAENSALPSITEINRTVKYSEPIGGIV